MTEHAGQFRVLVADDHVLFREGLKNLVAGDPGLDLVAEVGDGEAAVEAALRLQPDVVLMDIRMPGISGVEAARLISSASPHVAVLMLTMFEDDHLVLASMRAGARGYLVKDAGREDVLRAIRAAGNGEAIFSPAIARRFMEYFSELRATPVRAAFPELSDREREVLSLVAEGARNPAIARRLGISPKTVRNHLSNVLSKLQVADRAEAIIKAREAGFG
ncbi:MAG: response regulator transcription factor [Candidatus Dormibacteraceae bacterium]